MEYHVFGIRHHGPGCARSLLAALGELTPDVIVMEGPAEAEEVLSLASHEGLKPPVAVLIYPPEEPRLASYYPMTEFSPEWQALRWALGRKVPVRLMDLPQSIRLAMPDEDTAKEEYVEVDEDEGDDQDGDSVPMPSLPAPLPKGEGRPSVEETGGEDVTWRTDPLALLAEAAGYKDHELWWEEQIERRVHAAGLFDAIAEAMRTVREEVGETRPIDLVREAHMRQTLRRVLKEDFKKVAVVCGAWHVPALDEEMLQSKREGFKAKDDEALLKPLAKRKTAVTWIPWTYTRLTHASGYGAGVNSPGWYAHLWHSDRQAPIRWAATAARLLREKDLDASSASVIEAVRLADALAAMRELRSPGLAELNEAILTVLCHGDYAPMGLIRRRLEIGDVLGEVPTDSPVTPLAGDLAAWQKRLRLKPSSEIRPIDLDLRKETDLLRSQLLHRLTLLNIPWGDLRQSGGGVSTFHEIWQLEWKPEFAVAIIEANVWGNTVEVAAAVKVIQEADKATELPQITQLLDASILAGLSGAVDPLLDRIQAQAAVATDVRHLLEALLPMARVARYGNVRGTNAEQILPIIVGMFERAIVGLPAACSALDDEAAERMLESISLAQQALDLLNRDDLDRPWLDRLQAIMESGVHGLLRGWCCRLLLEKGRLDSDELYRIARLTLSMANPPAECAAWATGLLKGSSLLLLNQDNVWKVFDRWVSELMEETFKEMLPLLRRAFCDFSPAERRQMGEKVKHLGAADGKPGAAARKSMLGINEDRAKLALPVLAQILGVAHADG